MLFIIAVRDYYVIFERHRYTAYHCSATGFNFAPFFKEWAHGTAGLESVGLGILRRELR
jgi:hypothetical protein